MAVNLAHAFAVYNDKHRGRHTPRKTLCCLCDASLSPSEHGLCEPCAADLPGNRPACPGCAVPMAGDHPCPTCTVTKRPALDRVFALYRYDYPVNLLIQAMKYQARPAIARFLGRRLAREVHCLKPNGPTCLLPVPLHPLRLARRGYNQSLEIAAPVADSLGIPLLRASASRCRHTRPQSELPLSRRRGNVAGAFRIRDRNLPQHVIIIDDVMTSGATATTLARTLKNAGVRRVEAWAIARAGHD